VLGIVIVTLCPMALGYLRERRERREQQMRARLDSRPDRQL
jgi:hypothetical protein